MYVGRLFQSSSFSSERLVMKLLKQYCFNFVSQKANPLDSSEFLVAVKECFDEGSAAEVLDLTSNNEFKVLASMIILLRNPAVCL